MRGCQRLINEDPERGLSKNLWTSNEVDVESNDKGLAEDGCTEVGDMSKFFGVLLWDK
jgi:hypothetical protein